MGEKIRDGIQYTNRGAEIFESVKIKSLRHLQQLASPLRAQNHPNIPLPMSGSRGIKALDIY